MNFMKLISSLDELLYEIASWLLFFPITLWRSTVRPIGTMDYAESQLLLPEEEQYGATINPPLFLALTLLVVAGLNDALGHPDQIVVSKHGLATVINDDTTALILRVVLYSSFPIFAAARLLRRRKIPIERHALRGVFFAQCYPTGVFAFLVGIGTSLLITANAQAHEIGAALIVLGVINYVIVETRWFAAKLKTGHLWALCTVTIVLLQGMSLVFLVGYLLRN